MSPTEIVIASVFGTLIFVAFILVIGVSVSEIINDSRRRKEREKREQTD